MFPIHYNTDHVYMCNNQTDNTTVVIGVKLK